MTFEKVDPKELAGIVAKGDVRKKRPGVATVIDTSVRNHQTWFKLKQSFGECSNTDCIDPRLATNGGTHSGAMIAMVNDKNTCRYCFLNGYLL